MDSQIEHKHPYKAQKDLAKVILRQTLPIHQRWL